MLVSNRFHAELAHCSSLLYLGMQRKAMHLAAGLRYTVVVTHSVPLCSPRLMLADVTAAAPCHESHAGYCE
jgi:hypothetical protein